MKKYLLIFIAFPALFFPQKQKIDSLKNLLHQFGEDTNKLRIYFDLINEWNVINVDSAAAICDKAIMLSRKMGNKGVVGAAHNVKGNMYLGKAEYEAALKEYRSALEIFRSINYKTGIAVIYGGMANTYTFKGEHDSAVKYRILAIKVSEETGSKKKIAIAYGSLGQLYLTLKNNEKALECFMYNYKAMEELGNKAEMIIPLNNVAYTLMKLKKDDEAMLYLAKAKKLCDETKNNQALSMILYNMGSIYQEKKQLTRALPLYEQALKMAESFGEVHDISVALAALGDINLELKNYDKALYYFKKSYAVFLREGINEQIQDALLGISAAYEKKGNLSEALKFYKIYSDNKDSILNKDISLQMADMSTKYETEKKEDKIKLLGKESELQKAEAARKQAELESVRNTLITGSVLLVIVLGSVFFYTRNRRATEKIKMEKQLLELEHQALRLQMNPHFIFNSLSSINNFIGKNETAEAKRFLAKFSRLMRLILENSRYEFIPLQKEMDYLQNYLELEQLRFNNKFSFQITVDMDIDTENTLIPPLLIQPHIENAILHGIASKETKGKILLSLTKLSDGIRCEITDDGVGRKRAGEIKKMQNINHRSMAMSVTQERLQNFNTSVNTTDFIFIEDLQDANGSALGTRVSFNLPFKLKG